MRRVLPLLALLLLAACDLDLTDLDAGCADDAITFTEVIDALDAEVLAVDADRGHLDIHVVEGSSRVRIRGTACADDRTAREAIDLFFDDDGLGTIGVWTEVPAGSNARLDLVIEVPDWMSVDVIHREGGIDIEGVVDAYVDDEGGDIEITNVFRDVRLYDGSGHVVIRDVGDDVWIRDGSGNIDVDDVGGDLTVAANSSGSITHRNVRGTVRLP